MAFRYCKGAGQATALSAWCNAGGRPIKQPPPRAGKWIRQDGADENVPHFSTADFHALAGIQNVDTIINGHMNTTTTWDDLRVFAEFNQDFLTWAQAALKAGKAAQAGLVTGDLSEASVRRTKGMCFAKLCDLAEALTFVDRSLASVESEQAVEGADRLFRETLADAHTRNEVARIAEIWIDSPHRGHGGIFLAGTLSGGQIAGDVYEYELTTEGSGKLTLLIEEPIDPMVESSGHPVGIVGSIVENPADGVAGYRGTAERAIWVARAIPLD